jgi:hypothetical protein
VKNSLFLVYGLGAHLVVAQTFREKVYPVLEKAECRMCHHDNGVSSATRLLFPPENASADAVQAFGLSLSALVNRQDPDQSLLLRKPTTRVAHTGGERIKRGSPEEAVLRDWVRELAAMSGPELRAAIEKLNGAKKTTRPPALRRLTHSQYNATVRDLLGDFTRPADQFPPEDYLNGFTNQVEGQSTSPLLAEAYAAAAEKLADNAARQGELTKLLPCKSCGDQFIRKFGLRAFRRPLTESEVQGYRQLFARGGAKLVVEAMLQSPSFLFHLEEGADGRYRQYAIASKLSYLIWDTMPNDELLTAAAAEQLGDEAAIRRTARRMMDDPRAKRALEVFLAQWLRFDRVLASARNVRRYPDFGPSLLAAMTEETRHLFDHLVWNDRNFMEFFSADYTFVSARLAQLYELPPPAQDFEMVRYPAGSTRAGVLGHAGFLTLTGNPNETSPTGRGLFVREHFLCQNVPPPPPGVDTNLPAVSAEKPMTTRERLAEHARNPTCAACHSLIDPIGSGLEGFDNIGRHRDKLLLKLQQERDSVTNQPRPPKDFELPLDTNGFIQGVSSSKFSTGAELGRILANEPTCQRCVVKQVFRFALGRHEEEGDQPHLDALFARFRSSGFQFRELMLALVTSPPFLGSPAAAPVAVARKER